MLNGSTHPYARQSGTSHVALIAGLGGAAFVLGIVLTSGVVQLNAQKQQISQLNQAVAERSQQRDAEQDVTRTAPADLLSLSSASVAPETIVGDTQQTSPTALVQRAVAASNPPAVLSAATCLTPSPTPSRRTQQRQIYGHC